MLILNELNQFTSKTLISMSSTTVWTFLCQCLIWGQFLSFSMYTIWIFLGFQYFDLIQIEVNSCDLITMWSSVHFGYYIVLLGLSHLKKVAHFYSVQNWPAKNYSDWKITIFEELTSNAVISNLETDISNLSSKIAMSFSQFLANTV